MIKNAIKFLVKDTAIYGIAGAVTKFIAIFTIPIIVRVLTKEEFGILNTVMSMSTMFVGFIVLGMDSSIARWFFDGEEGNEEYKIKIATTGFFVQLVGLAVTTICLLVGLNSIGNLLFDNQVTLVEYWKIYLLSVPATSFLLFSNNLFKWNFERNRYLFLTLGNAIVNVSLTLLFLLYFEMGLLSALLGPIISSNIFGIVGLIMNKRYIDPSKIGDIELIKKMLNYGWPFALLLVIAAFTPSIDRLFLLRYVNMDVVGEYSLSLKLAGLMMMVISAFQISFGPYAFSIWKKEEAPKIFSDLLVLYFTLLMVISVFMMVFGDFAIKVFASEKYLSAIIPIPILTTAFAIKGIAEFSLIGITWSKKSYYNILCTLVMLISIFAFNYILTPRFTVLGAATALLISNIIYIIVSFLISHQYYRIKIQWTKLILIIVFSTIVHSICFIGGQGYFIRYIALILYVISVYYVILTKKQREGLEEFLLSMKAKFK